MDNPTLVLKEHARNIFEQSRHPRNGYFADFNT